MKKILPLLAGFTLCGITAQAQLPVSTAPQNKNVVLEEFTGIYCTWCPDGHRLAKQLADQNPGDVVLINIHTGGFATPQNGAPDYRTSFGGPIAGQASIAGYPAGTINRRVFPGKEQNPGGTAMSRGEWASAAAEVLAEPSYVNVALEGILDASATTLTINVEMYFTDDAPGSYVFLNVAILQDNIVGPQTGMTKNPDQVVSSGKYNHQHMLRHMVTGPWGELISTTTQGTKVTKTYTYTIPADINGVAVVPEDLEVVAFVAENKDHIVTGTTGWTGYVGLDEQEVSSFSVYPNPASEVLNVEMDLENAGDMNYAITDLSGKVVLSDNFASSAGKSTAAISISELPAGVYMVHLSANGESAVERVVISH